MNLNRIFYLLMSPSLHKLLSLAKKKKNKTTTKNNRQTNKVNQRYTLLAFDLNKAHNQLSNKDNGL